MIVRLMRDAKRMYGLRARRLGRGFATPREGVRNARFLRRRGPRWPIRQDITPGQLKCMVDQMLRLEALNGREPVECTARCSQSNE